MTTSAPALGLNAGQIGQDRPNQRLATPILALDLDAMERNIALMQDLAATAGMAIRPHAKTHKSPEIARKQIAAGALGVCCASLREADVMITAGVPGALITSPVVGPVKLARLSELLADAEGLMVVCDHADNAGELDEAARRADRVLDVLVDIDVGLGRTGIASPDQALALARQIDGAAHLAFKGLQGYSGAVQHIESYSERATTYGAHVDHLEAVRDTLVAVGLKPEIISGGGTGTNELDRQRGLFTELQCGSYIFMDVEYNLVQIFEDNHTPFESALTVLTSVVSNNQDGFVTIDGGLKCFATDGPLPQIVAGTPQGASYTYFGDEHGRISFAETGQSLALGHQVRLAAPHCDPTVNLHNYYHCFRAGVLSEIWPVAARGVL